jgi:hypothetical protein
LSTITPPTNMLIDVNQAAMDKLANDAERNGALGHEVGHALGLAHTDFCALPDGTPSLMYSVLGTDHRPTPFDKGNLQDLYGLR